MEVVNQTDPGYGFWVLFGLFLLWGSAWDKLQSARYYLDGRLAGAHTMSNLLLNARLIQDPLVQRAYIGLLTTLVRYNYEQQAKTAVSLQEELAQAAALVAMHNLSHQQKVRWEPDAHLQDMEMELPPFSLLCLVENALAHGVDPGRDEVAIRIHAGRVKGSMQALCLSGFGMPQPKVLKRPPKGHGLHYLSQRLYRFCVAKSMYHYFEKPVVKGDHLIVQFPV
ncbi:MAG: sensor histidine kinase [Bacteroidota bacterium]